VNSITVVIQSLRSSSSSSSNESDLGGAVALLLQDQHEVGLILSVVTNARWQ